MDFYPLAFARFLYVKENVKEASATDKIAGCIAEMDEFC